MREIKTSLDGARLYETKIRVSHTGIGIRTHLRKRQSPLILTSTSQGKHSLDYDDNLAPVSFRLLRVLILVYQPLQHCSLSVQLNSRRQYRTPVYLLRYGRRTISTQYVVPLSATATVRRVARYLYWHRSVLYRSGSLQL